MAERYFIGTSGFNYRHWKGKFYPKEISQKDWLSFYSKNFNTVEINYSFYRWPSQKTIKRWYESSPENFKFTLKAPRTITHIRQIKNTEKWVKNFYKLSSLLKEKFGCILFQLPPKMGFDLKNFEKLKKFLKSLDRKKENVIEFRDESWWNEEIYNLLEEQNVCFCIVNGLGMPKDIILTSNIAYFRFHGAHYSTCYSKREMKDYASEMKKLKVKKIFAYFNNDAMAFAVRNANELKNFIL